MLVEYKKIKSGCFMKFQKLLYLPVILPHNFGVLKNNLNTELGGIFK